MIFHVCRTSEWEAFASSDRYTPAAYPVEGFIHCCRYEQLSGVLERYFNGATGLLLLHIDEHRLHAELRYEPGAGGEKFPHVYGPIDKHAVTRVEMLI